MYFFGEERNKKKKEKIIYRRQVKIALKLLNLVISFYGQKNKRKIKEVLNWFVNPTKELRDLRLREGEKC